MPTEHWRQRRARQFQLDKRDFSRRRERLKSSTGHVRRGPTEYTYSGTRYYHEEGSRYEGELHARDGRLPNPHGKGTLFNHRGVNVYVGAWVQGEKHGDGTLFYTNGCPHFEGYFLNDTIVEGKIYRKNGEVEYDGKIKDWVPDDEGTYFFPDGRTMFVGSFSNGFFDGDGIEYTQCGRMDRCVSGIWKCGKIKKQLEEQLVPRDHSMWVNADTPSNTSNWPTNVDDVAVVIQDAWILYKERMDNRRAESLAALKRRLLPVDYMDFTSTNAIPVREKNEMVMTEEPVNESEGPLADHLLQVAKMDGGMAEDESPKRKQIAEDETGRSTSLDDE